MFKIKELNDFAVIKTLKNELELKDLTIFMGDNSAGKSYVAMLIHSFITMTRGYSDSDFQKAIKSKFAKSLFVLSLEVAILNILKDSNEKFVLSFNDEQLKDLKEIIQFALNEYLIKKYLTNALFEKQNLKKIDIELFGLEKCLPKMLVVKYNNSELTQSIEFSIDDSTQGASSFQGIFDSNFIIEKTFNSVLSALIEHTVKKTLPSTSVYLPASRTGYLQTFQTLSNDAIMNNFSLKDKKIKNTLSIIVRFFLTQLNTYTNFKEDKFATFIEDSIMNGTVNIFKDNNEIEFKLKNGSTIDLNYLSSTVSELIPLVVFLKRGIIKRNGLLVIEEPEAHLSFKNQKLIAKLIVYMLQNNIKILITTHSDFLIYELNNLILRDTILKNKNKISQNDINFDFTDTVSLDYKKVGLYNFILDNGSSSIERVAVGDRGIKNKYIFDSTYSIANEKNELLDILDFLDADS